MKWHTFLLHPFCSPSSVVYITRRKWKGVPKKNSLERGKQIRPRHSWTLPPTTKCLSAEVTTTFSFALPHFSVIFLTRHTKQGKTYAIVSNTKRHTIMENVLLDICNPAGLEVHFMRKLCSHVRVRLRVECQSDKL